MCSHITKITGETKYCFHCIIPKQMKIRQRFGTEEFWAQTLPWSWCNIWYTLYCWSNFLKDFCFPTLWNPSIYNLWHHHISHCCHSFKYHCNTAHLCQTYYCSTNLIPIITLWSPGTLSKASISHHCLYFTTTTCLKLVCTVLWIWDVAMSYPLLTETHL